MVDRLGGDFDRGGSSTGGEVSTPGWPPAREDDEAEESGLLLVLEMLKREFFLDPKKLEAAAGPFLLG